MIVETVQKSLFMRLLKYKMSKRKMKGTGWVDYKKHPRGPNGRGLCRMCGEEVPKGRRTFCGEDCVHQYKLRNQPNYVARQLRKKDKGICSLCGINTKEVEKEFVTEHNLCWKLKGEEAFKCMEEVTKRWAEKGWSPNCGRWWHADHIVPVAEGGGPQDWPLSEDYLSNFRTLCVPCHKKETRELRARLRKKRSNK